MSVRRFFFANMLFHSKFFRHFSADSGSFSVNFTGLPRCPAITIPFSAINFMVFSSFHFQSRNINLNNSYYNGNNCHCLVQHTRVGFNNKIISKPNDAGK